MEKVIRINQFIELDRYDIDGRQFEMNYDYGILSDDKLFIEINGKVRIIFSETLETKWGSSISPVIAHILEILIIAAKKGSLSEINKIDLNSNTASEKLNIDKDIIGKIIKINEGPLW